MRFAFRRYMLFVFVLAIAEIVWAVIAGFPSEARVIELPLTTELNVTLALSPAGAALTLALITAAWRQIRPAYGVLLLLEGILVCVLAIDLLASGPGPLTVALGFTATRLALLLRPSVRRMLVSGTTLRAVRSQRRNGVTAEAAAGGVRR